MDLIRIKNTLGKLKELGKKNRGTTTPATPMNTGSLVDTPNTMHAGDIHKTNPINVHEEDENTIDKSLANVYLPPGAPTTGPNIDTPKPTDFPDDFENITDVSERGIENIKQKYDDLPYELEFQRPQILPGVGVVDKDTREAPEIGVEPTGGLTTTVTQPPSPFGDISTYNPQYNKPGSIGERIGMSASTGTNTNLHPAQSSAPSTPAQSPLNAQVTRNYIEMLQGRNPAMEQNQRIAEGVLAKMATQGRREAHERAVQMGFKPGEKGYNDIMERQNQKMSSQGSQILSGLTAQNLASSERALAGAGQYGYGQQKLGLGYDQLDLGYDQLGLGYDRLKTQSDLQKAGQQMQLLGYHDLFSEGQVGAIKGGLGDTYGLSSAESWGNQDPSYAQQKVADFMNMGYSREMAEQKAKDAIRLEDPNKWLEKMLNEFDFGNITEA